MKKYLFIVGTLLFAGCSAPYREAPIATNFKTTTQHKLGSLYHWKIITKDIINQVSTKLQYKKIYLNLPVKTTFEKTFNNLLRNNLINKGFKIVFNKKDADITIDYDLDVVKFNNRDLRNRDNIGKYTLIGSLTSGVILLTKHSVVTDAAAGIAAAGGVAIDAYNYFNSDKTKTPLYEISITLNIKNKYQYVGSINRIYYVADEDFSLYKNTVFKIKG